MKTEQTIDKRITVKHLHTMETANGTAYRCTVMVDGEDVGLIYNEGNGGAGVMNWKCSDERRAVIEKEIEALPAVEFYGSMIQRDLDCLIDEAINAKQNRR